MLTTVFERSTVTFSSCNTIFIKWIVCLRSDVSLPLYLAKYNWPHSIVLYYLCYHTDEIFDRGETIFFGIVFTRRKCWDHFQLTSVGLDEFSWLMPKLMDITVHVIFWLTSQGSWVRKNIRNHTVNCKQWPSLFPCWLGYIHLTLSIAHQYRHHVNQMPYVPIGIFLKYLLT